MRHLLERTLVYVLRACLCVCVFYTLKWQLTHIFVWAFSSALCYHRNSYCMSPLFGKVSMNHPLSFDWSACPKVILAWLRNKLFNWVIKTSLERDCKDMKHSLAWVYWALMVLKVSTSIISANRWLEPYGSMLVSKYYFKSRNNNDFIKKY